MKKLKLTDAAGLVIAALTAVMGLIVMLFSGETAVLPVWMGAVLTALGIGLAAGALIRKRTPFGSRPFFTRGMLLFLAGLLILLQGLTAEGVPALFLASVILSGGVNMAGAAQGMGRGGVKGRMVLAGLGVLEALLAALCFLRTDVIVIGPGVRLGLALAADGAVTAYACVMAMRLREAVRAVREAAEKKDKQ